MVNGIDRLNAFEDVFYRIMHGIFSRLYCKAFMSHVLKSNDLIPNFPLSKLLPRNALVLEVVRTVDTTVNAVVGKIKRSKHNYCCCTAPHIDQMMANEKYFICENQPISNIPQNPNRRESKLASLLSCSFRISRRTPVLQQCHHRAH